MSNLKALFGIDFSTDLFIESAEMVLPSHLKRAINYKIEGINEIIGIYEFDGSYILRFRVSEDKSEDFIDSVYDEVSAKKFDNKEKRGGFIDNIGVIMSIEEDKNKKEEYANDAEELLKLLKNESEN